MTASTADRPPSTVQAEGQLILEPLTPPCAARRRSYTATGDSFAWSSPAVANGVLYLGSNHVYAFGLPGGSEQSADRLPGSFTPTTHYAPRTAPTPDRPGRCL